MATIYNAVFRADQQQGETLVEGSPGVSRRDLWLGGMIHLVPYSVPAGATFRWVFLDKPSTSTVEFLNESSELPDSTAQYVKFEPDVWGTYRVQLVINNGQYSYVMLLAVILSAEGAVTRRGWRIPSFKEIHTEANFPGQTRGYADDWDYILEDLLATASGGFTAGGDLSGSGLSQTVVGIQGNSVGTGTPEVGDSLVWDGTKFAIQPVMDDTNTLVFHPGGTQEDNVFTSWSDLMAEFVTTAGIVSILVEDWDVSPAVIPTGIWDLEDRGIISGTIRGYTTELVVGDGVGSARLSNPAGFKNLNVTNDTDGYIDSIDGGLVFFAEDTSFTGADTAGPLLYASDNSRVYLRGKSTLSAAVSAHTLELEDDEAEVDVYVQDFSSISSNTLKVPADGVLTVYLSNSVTSCSETQTDVVGTFTVEGPAFGSSVGTTFVFQPGGSVSDNVYTDWTLLMAALATKKGPKVIEFDHTQDANLRCDIPEGVWSLGGNTVLRGRWALTEGAPSWPVNVVMSTDAQFEDATLIEGGLYIWSRSSDVVFVWSGNTKHLVLRDNVRLIGDQYDILTAPAAPLIGGAGIEIDVHDNCMLLASGVDATVLETDAESTNIINLYDHARVGGSATSSAEGVVFAVGVDGSLVVNVHSPAVYLQNEATVGVSWVPYCTRQLIVPLAKTLATRSLDTPTAIGGACISYQQLPKHQNLQCKFRTILETTLASAGYEAYIDLFDVHGQLSAGTPSVVTGSPTDTTTGSPPSGAPTPNPLLPSVYEVDLTSAIVGGTWVSDILVLEARLWIGLADGENGATCKSAELVFSW